MAPYTASSRGTGMESADVAPKDARYPAAGATAGRPYHQAWPQLKVTPSHNARFVGATRRSPRVLRLTDPKHNTRHPPPPLSRAPVIPAQAGIHTAAVQYRGATQVSFRHGYGSRAFARDDGCCVVGYVCAASMAWIEQGRVAPWPRRVRRWPIRQPNADSSLQGRWPWRIWHRAVGAGYRRAPSGGPKARPHTSEGQRPSECGPRSEALEMRPSKRANDLAPPLTHPPSPRRVPEPCSSASLTPTSIPPRTPSTSRSFCPSPGGCAGRWATWARRRSATGIQMACGGSTRSAPMARQSPATPSTCRSFSSIRMASNTVSF